ALGRSTAVLPRADPAADRGRRLRGRAARSRRGRGPARDSPGAATRARLPVPGRGGTGPRPARRCRRAPARAASVRSGRRAPALQRPALAPAGGRGDRAGPAPGGAAAHPPRARALPQRRGRARDARARTDCGAHLRATRLTVSGVGAINARPRGLVSPTLPCWAHSSAVQSGRLITGETLVRIPLCPRC